MFKFCKNCFPKWLYYLNFYGKSIRFSYHTYSPTLGISVLSSHDLNQKANKQYAVSLTLTIPMDACLVVYYCGLHLPDNSAEHLFMCF